MEKVIGRIGKMGDGRLGKDKWTYVWIDWRYTPNLWNCLRAAEDLFMVQATAPVKINDTAI